MNLTQVVAFGLANKDVDGSTIGKVTILTDAFSAIIFAGLWLNSLKPDRLGEYETEEPTADPRNEGRVPLRPTEAAL